MHPIIALRSGIYLALLVVTVVPYAIAMLLMAWIPRDARYWMATGWTRFAIWCGRVVCGLKWEVHGMENLPDAPVILLPKHQSAWETMWITTAMPRPLSFVYKRELHYLPFFGWALATLKMIHIDRSKGSDAFEQVVEQGTAQLQRGGWIVIFPEGTRRAPGAEPKYKTGGARLAVRTGAKVVPVALNSGELWPRKAFLKMPGTITVTIGPPIDPAGKTGEEVAAQVQDWTETEMHRLAPHRYPQEQIA